LKNKKTIVIHARLDKATYLKVKKLAELYKVSISTILRLLIDASLGDKLAQSFLKTTEPTEKTTEKEA
jgi:DeoR/GlpR family transcriptional regulator of sugar metabolism